MRFICESLPKSRIEIREEFRPKNRHAQEWRDIESQINQEHQSILDGFGRLPECALEIMSIMLASREVALELVAEKRNEKKTKPAGTQSSSAPRKAA
jgi:hypothetical protein